MLADPFELTKFPKLAGKRPSMPVQCVNDTLYVGVSGSSINKLALLPPQVLSAHAVAPGTSVTSILATESGVIAYATSERGKFFLKRLDADNKVCETIEVPEEVAAIYGSSTRIATISKKNATITTYDLELKVVATSSLDLGSLKYTAAVPDEEGADQTVFCAVVQVKSELVLRTFVLESGRGGVRLLVASSPLEFRGKHWSLYGNYLFCASSHTELAILRVPDGTVITSFDLGGEDITGIVALPHQNVLVARNSTLEMVDCTYESQIASITVPGTGNFQLLAFSPAASTVVCMRHQDVLLGLSVSPSSGTLLESIGRCSARKPQSFAFADIFSGFEPTTESYKSVAERGLARAAEEKDDVLRDLRQYINARDGIKFAEIVPYLKDPKLKWEDDIVALQEDQVYEETDRVTDRGLIYEVCKMTFLPNFKSSFLPNGVALYLLTHPLFPTHEPGFEKLLKKLEMSDINLYRQAIVSLAGLTVEDLVNGLVCRDEATFLDAAARLQEEYGQQQILAGVRRAFSSVQSLSSLTVIVERLSRYPETVRLISSFIDTMSLLAWDNKHLGKLKSTIGESVDSLELLARADAAIMDLFDSVGLDPSAPIPSQAELQSRSARKSAVRAQNDFVSKYSVETLAL